MASFSAACSGGGTCIPQPGTTQKLDSLADRLMYRLAYRNFGDHQSLVVNHSVTAGTATSVRWYEIRSPGGTPAVYQQGTLSASDGISRWMGSVAMDKLGNIALGYSASSSSVYPSIRYTGRLATDALNTMQAESLIQAGAGSQTAGLSRWGDYSAMTVDPVDDCTFWYTNEYLKANGTWNWSTRIASFRFPNCVTSVPVLTTISVSPASASVQTGQTQQFTATGLDQFGNPVSPPPPFTWSVSPSAGTISGSGLFTASATAGGPYTVTAASGNVSGTANVTVTSVPSDFSLSVSPMSRSVKQGNAATYVVTITPSNDFNGSVTLSVTGLPSAFTATFSPNPATTTSTLTVKTVQGYHGTYKLTIQGVSGSLQHTTPATLTVTNH